MRDGTDVNNAGVSGDTALHHAARLGNLSSQIIFKFILFKYQFSEKILFVFGLGNEKIVKVLLHNNAISTIKNKNGKTPIDVATEAGNLSIDIETLQFLENTILI